MMYMPFWAWSLWGDAPLERVERLTFGVGPQWVSMGKPWPTAPPLATVLDGVERSAPTLTSLAFWHRPWTADEIRLLAVHPILERLHPLELFNVHAAFDFEALLDVHDRLAHLRCLVVGSHLVPGPVLARVSEWPAVRFASYDRRELYDLDVMWTRGAARGGGA